MKNHVKYLISFISIIAAILIIGSVILTNQFFKFYNSYIQEEKEEMNHNLLLVEWSVTPLLRDKDNNKLASYYKDLYDKDIAIFIFDKNENLIGTSRPDIDGELLKVIHYNRATFKNYKHSLKNKMLVQEKEININNEAYTIKIALLEDDMIKTFLHNQKSIILFYIACILLITLFSVYTIFNLKIPFDKLQESAIKIMNGDMDTDIFVIEKGLLSEHSKTINNMARQLKQKINELKQLETARRETQSGLSHEVKTPLTSLTLASEFLKDNIKSDNKEINECINIIQTNSERLNSLILNIIDIANLENQSINQKNEFSEFDLSACIYSAIDNSKILAKNIKINYINPKQIMILADSQLLETAILNILTNAIRYSESDKIDVSADIENESAIIKIKDYGIGIPTEHISKIFDKFYRVDKNRSREKGGSGLGLAIVKNIIDLHNGKISVKSENGCEFTIILPLK